jgi:hypothetical protein
MPTDNSSLEVEPPLTRAWANSSRDPILKNPITKNWAGEVARGEGPEFKPQYRKNK